MYSQECGAVMWAYAMPACVLFVSSRSRIVFNPSAGAITDHSQSANDIDQYFKSRLYVEDHGHRTPVIFYRLSWVNLKSARTTEILISAVGEIRTHSVLIDSPARYHWTITALYQKDLLQKKFILPVCSKDKNPPQAYAA